MRENLFGLCVEDITDEEELLIVLDEQLDEVEEAGERRIGDDNIGLFQKRETFGAVKTSIAVKVLDLDLLVIDALVLVLVALVNLIDGSLALADRKQIRVLAFVASRDHLLQAKQFKVEGEVLEEIAAPRIIAITQDDLALEVFAVMLQLVFNVRELGIMLVVLLVARTVYCRI